MKTFDSKTKQVLMTLFLTLAITSLMVNGFRTAAVLSAGEYFNGNFHGMEVNTDFYTSSNPVLNAFLCVPQAIYDYAGGECWETKLSSIGMITLLASLAFLILTIFLTVYSRVNFINSLARGLLYAQEIYWILILIFDVIQWANGEVLLTQCMY